MKARKILDSFNYAIEGLVYAFRTQRNMKIHFIIAILTLVAAIVLGIDRNQAIMLFITITLVIGSEMINTAIETIVDMISPQYHPMAKIAKNLAAGAVLVTAFNAIVVGYLVFFDKIHDFTWKATTYAREMPAHLTFASLCIVLLTVIIAKAINQKGTFLRGGLPSGHSALAFSLFASITLVSGDALVATLSGILAILVAQSRLQSGIHNFFEVVAGGILGILITMLVFRLVFPKF